MFSQQLNKLHGGFYTENTYLTRLVVSNIEVSLLLKQHMQVTLTSTRTITSAQAPYFYLSQDRGHSRRPNPTRSPSYYPLSNP